MVGRRPSTKTFPIGEALNLGPVSSKWLQEVGINTLEDLERLGPVDVFRMVKMREPKATLNLLYALAAALQGKDWRALSEADKNRLKQSLDR